HATPRRRQRSVALGDGGDERVVVAARRAQQVAQVDERRAAEGELPVENRRDRVVAYQQVRAVEVAVRETRRTVPCVEQMRIVLDGAEDGVGEVGAEVRCART